MDIIFGSISVEQRRADIDKRQKGNVVLQLKDASLLTPSASQNSTLCHEIIHIPLSERFNPVWTVKLPQT